MLLAAVVPDAAGEDDDREKSMDSTTADCRSLAVRIRCGAGVSC
jgi:hypothetical protein